MRPILYTSLETVPSTNTWVKERAASFDPGALTCVYAHEQTAGRGRFNRKWLSAKGNNILATLYFCVPLHFPYIGNCTQVLSLVCMQVLEERGFKPQIKWPNDLILEGKKLGGILCETVGFPTHIGVVLGIGINVDTPQTLLDTLDQPAIALGVSWKREELLHSLVERFCAQLDVLSTEGFTPFHKTYVEHLAFKEKWVTRPEGRGKYHAIDEKGQFVLALEGGELVTICSGEMTHQG